MTPGLSASATTVVFIMDVFLSLIAAGLSGFRSDLVGLERGEGDLTDPRDADRLCGGL